MKKVLLLFLFVPFVLNGQMIQHVTSVVTCTDVDALARYDFENDNSDEEGDYDLTEVGGVTYSGTYYKTGSYSLNLNQASDRWATADYGDLGDEFSISFWVRKATISGTPWFFDSYDGSSDGFAIYVHGTNDQIIVLTNDGGTSNSATSNTSLGLPDATWFHIAVVVDKSAGTCVIYYNGSDVTSDGSIKTTFATDNVCIIGSDSYYPYCYIDQLQVYKWKLTSSQVSDLYSNPSNEQEDCL